MRAIHFEQTTPRQVNSIKSDLPNKFKQDLLSDVELQLLCSFSDGFEFFESANKVILCPGDEKGFLPPKYFKKVVHRKKGRKKKLFLKIR